MIYNITGIKDRLYLYQWFYNDILLVTDDFIWEKGVWSQEKNKFLDINIQEHLTAHTNKQIVLDLSQNCFPHNHIPDCLVDQTTLTAMYDHWYNQTSANIHFFPIWMYMYSNRNNFNGMYRNRFDALGTKTQGVMCLNRGGREHRVKFYELMKDYKGRMCLTAPIVDGLPWQTERLPDDVLDIDGLPMNDVGIENPVYDQYAVNVVTETQIDFPSLTEKCCKPFIARQIPIIVGNPGVNQFLVDLGIDMFEDVVPWRSWDNQNDKNIKLKMIADFIKSWVDSGNVLRDYNLVQDRVEKNKQYFHSDKFREIIMKNMPKVNFYS